MGSPIHCLSHSPNLSCASLPWANSLPWLLSFPSHHIIVPGTQGWPQGHVGVSLPSLVYHIQQISQPYRVLLQHLCPPSLPSYGHCWWLVRASSCQSFKFQIKSPWYSQSLTLWPLLPLSYMAYLWCSRFFEKGGFLWFISAPSVETREGIAVLRAHEYWIA